MYWPSNTGDWARKQREPDAEDLRWIIVKQQLMDLPTYICNGISKNSLFPECLGFSTSHLNILRNTLHVVDPAVPLALEQSQLAGLPMVNFSKHHPVNSFVKMKHSEIKLFHKGIISN